MSDRDRSDFLKDPSAHRLVAGDLEAVFLSNDGMLGASLRYRGVEMLRRVDDLAASAAKGSTGYPTIKDLFTADDLGGWNKLVTDTVFGPNGAFTKAFQAAKG